LSLYCTGKRLICLWCSLQAASFLRQPIRFAYLPLRVTLVIGSPFVLKAVCVPERIFKACNVISCLCLRVVVDDLVMAEKR
jgi:hypothetical protein